MSYIVCEACLRKVREAGRCSYCGTAMVSTPKPPIVTPVEDPLKDIMDIPGPAFPIPDPRETGPSLQSMTRQGRPALILFLLFCIGIVAVLAWLPRRLQSQELMALSLAEQLSGIVDRSYDDVLEQVRTSTDIIQTDQFLNRWYLLGLAKKGDSESVADHFSITGEFSFRHAVIAGDYYANSLRWLDAAEQYGIALSHHPKGSLLEIILVKLEAIRNILPQSERRLD